MKVEKAEKTDALLLTDISIASKSYWGYSAKLMELWRESLTVTEEYITANEVYKLVDESRIVGYYSIIQLSEEMVQLDNFFISPEFIKKGYGSLLLSDCICRVKERGVKTIILDADPNAEGFYAGFGFVTYNRLETAVEGRYLPQMKWEY